MPRPRSPRRRCCTARRTRASATRSCDCSSSRCRPPPKSSTSSSPPCSAIRSSSCGPRATRATMRLSAAALHQFGEALGRGLTPPAVIGCSGELGTGKTTLIQAICRGLGARELATSPTYALVHHYETAVRRPVYPPAPYPLRPPPPPPPPGLSATLPP